MEVLEKMNGGEMEEGKMVVGGKIEMGKGKMELGEGIM